jgi:hypothetical protein
LEACLRFLLFTREDADEELPPDVDSESPSSEDFIHPSRGERDLTASILRNTKNLAEPRTSQGVFGPNGINLLLIVMNDMLMYTRTP